jgi:hypothetical protein
VLVIIGLWYYEEEIKEIPLQETRVVVATKDIAFKEKLTSNNTKALNVVLGDLDRDNLVLDTEYSEGKIANAPIYKGEMINTSRIVKNLKNDNRSISLELRKEDKALNLKKNQFVDLWIEPNELGESLEKTSLKLFEGKRIISIKNERYEEDESMPQYITVEMDSDDEVQKFLNISDASFYKTKVVVNDIDYSDMKERSK